MIFYNRAAGFVYERILVARLSRHNLKALALTHQSEQTEFMGCGGQLLVRVLTASGYKKRSSVGTWRQEIPIL